MNHIDVKSSIIKSIGYDSNTNTMEVNFHKTGIYTFNKVTEQDFLGFINADSVGSHFNKYIKGNYNGQQK